MSSWPPQSTFNPFSADSPPPAHRTSPNREHMGIAPHFLSNIPCPGSLPQFQPQPPISHTQQNAPAVWGYNPVFGIVHSLSGVCPVCKAYVNHIIAAMNQNEDSLAKAMESRRESQDTFFMDGFGEGMRHERQNSSELKKLQAQLDVATSVFENCVAENDSLRQELDRVKRQLANHEEQRRLMNSLAGQNSPQTNSSSRSPPSTSAFFCPGSRGSSIGSSLELTHCTGEDIGYTSLRPAAVTTEQYDGHIPQSPSVVSLNGGKMDKSVHSAERSTSTYASVASVRVSKNLASYSLPLEKISNNITFSPRPRPSTSVPDLMAPHFPAAPRSQHDRLHAKYPRTMKELKDLIDRAHEQTAEGAVALSIVKSICSHAHSTPRDSKTFMQRWILMNWKNPYTSTSTPATPVDVKPNPRIDDPVEIWYEYLCTHPHSWPKGVRKDALGRPVMPDLIANRAVARMRPTESASMRSDYISHVTSIFAVPGMYRELLEKNNLTVALKVTYKAFTGVITADTITQHFAESGITPEDAAINFEPWAKHYKEC